MMTLQEVCDYGLGILADRGRIPVCMPDGELLYVHSLRSGFGPGRTWQVYVRFTSESAPRGRDACYPEGSEEYGALASVVCALVLQELREKLGVDESTPTDLVPHHAYRRLCGCEPRG